MQDKDLTILIAEDDADDRFLLESAFKENSFPAVVRFVENGVELLEYLERTATTPATGSKNGKQLPQLILLDLNMPKKNGREVLIELKQMPAFRNIPVIIFSTTQNEKEVKNCYELGADSYILKPDSYSSLLQTVNTLKNSLLSGSILTTH